MECVWNHSLVNNINILLFQYCFTFKIIYCSNRKLYKIKSIFKYYSKEIKKLVFTKRELFWRYGRYKFLYSFHKKYLSQLFTIFYEIPLRIHILYIFVALFFHVWEREHSWKVSAVSVASRERTWGRFSFVVAPEQTFVPYLLEGRLFGKKGFDNTSRT